MTERVVAMSPHLDDAVLSLGAYLFDLAAAGADVRVVTVLAGDAKSRLPAGPWDVEAGFRTAGEAAQRRRAEDTRACETLGVAPVWLPFSDEQYERGASDTVIHRAVLDAVGEPDTVLLPGFPLAHQDHRWLVELLVPNNPWRRIGFYLEQPYALARGVPKSRTDVVTSFDGTRLGWSPQRWSEPGRRAKTKACSAYASQLRLLAKSMGMPWSQISARLSEMEDHNGGELVAWFASPEGSEI